MKRAHGFTLIELMVGVALGLLATVVIAQVFLQSEGNKRVATSGSDAQVTGASALYTLQRDIQSAGYGLTAWPAAIGCPLAGSFGGGTSIDPASTVLAPVVIGFGANTGASDTVTVLASGKAGYAVPTKVSSDHPATANAFTVSSNLGVAANDFMVAMPAAWGTGNGCTLFVATSTTGTTVINHAASNNWNTSTAIYPSAGYPSGSVLVNLGAAPVRRRYSVNVTATNDIGAWSLQVEDTLTPTNTSTPAEMFPQVVLLKALYGLTDATALDGAVTSYTATAPAAADWRRVQAIRLVVVVRSVQFERDAITTNAPEWAVGSQLKSADLGQAGTALGACRQDATSQCVTLDVSASGPGNLVDIQGNTHPAWQHYRYKVFDTIVPLRNVVWNPS